MLIMLAHTEWLNNIAGIPWMNVIYILIVVISLRWLAEPIIVKSDVLVTQICSCTCKIYWVRLVNLAFELSSFHWWYINSLINNDRFSIYRCLEVVYILQPLLRYVYVRATVSFLFLIRLLKPVNYLLGDRISFISF